MPEDSPLSQSGAAADSQFGNGPAGQTVKDCKQKTWIGIQLQYEDGKPVPNEPYRLQLPDGSIVEGSLDENGKAGVKEIDPGQCKVCFPRVDGRVWRPL